MKGLPRSLSRGRGAGASNVVKKVTIPFTKSIEIDGATGVGWGTVIIGDFPEGNISFMDATCYLTVTGPTSANLSDTWAGDYGIGTTPASDGTITAGDVDIIVSTALAAATAEVSPRTRAVGGAGALFDNTDGSLELNLNVLVDDADISADDLICTAEGVLSLAYVVLGDD